MGMQFEYTEDTVIIREKGSSKFMYLILDGSVALYTDYGTSDEYLYGVLGKGKTFGEIGLLTHGESIYTVVAISDVKVALFSENELGAFIRRYPDNALGVMRSMAKLNELFRINLRMVMEENKENVRYRELCESAIKQVTEDSEEVMAKWRSIDIS